MKSAIHIFGHPASVRGRDDTFDSDSIREYIENGIFGDDCCRRYRHNLKRDDAKIIVLSHAGEAYGHFEIIDWEDPKCGDIEAWPTTKRVYVVSKSHSYEKPVNLQGLGITHIQFGKPIDADTLQNIQQRAGKVTMHQPAAARSI